MLSCFTRVHLYLYHSGFVTEGTVVLREAYHAKLPKSYQIRGRADVQYSRRAQRAQIQETRIFLPNVIRYSLLFPSPPLSLLKKITRGQLDVVKCAKSEDVVLMFDEMYLQKYEAVK